VDLAGLRRTVQEAEARGLLADETGKEHRHQKPGDHASDKPEEQRCAHESLRECGGGMRAARSNEDVCVGALQFPSCLPN